MISAEWMAGFFDGEGCISLNISGKHRQVVPRVILVNTNEALMRQIQFCFGGRLVCRRLRDNWKPAYHLTWTGVGAMEFLEIIRPFVRLKKPQLDLASEYREFATSPKAERCELKIVGKRRGPAWVRSNKTVEQELSYKSRMHALNKKGVA